MKKPCCMDTDYNGLPDTLICSPDCWRKKPTLSEPQVETPVPDAAKCLACGQKMLPTDIWERRLHAANERINELEKDARRYRWLRKSVGNPAYCAKSTQYGVSMIYGEHLDAAIDAEIDK